MKCQRKSQKSESMLVLQEFRSNFPQLQMFNGKFMQKHTHSISTIYASAQLYRPLKMSLLVQLHTAESMPPPLDKHAFF